LFYPSHISAYSSLFSERSDNLKMIHPLLDEEAGGGVDVSGGGGGGASLGRWTQREVSRILERKVSLFQEMGRDVHHN
jgi:hypothetical protein